MIMAGREFARLCADVGRDKQNDVTIEMTLSKSEHKSVKINTVKRARIAEAVGQLNSVVFSAEDLAMIKGEPAERRRFLNLEISQISPQYMYALAGYKRALDQRNALLKTVKARGSGAETLSVWTDRLVEYGSTVILRRLDFIRKLSDLAGPIHLRLTNEVESLGMRYEPSFRLDGCETVEDIGAVFERELAEVSEQELARGTTVRGPHRDDVGFEIGGMDLRRFGSQGQQRTAALAIKLAEAQLVEETTGEPPVALVDDVMAELDEERRGHVFDLTYGRCQTFATATSLEEFTPEVVAGAAIFIVRKGEVTRRQ